MDSQQRRRRRRLAALISSLVAEILSLLLLLFPPSSNPLSITDCIANGGVPVSDQHDVVLPLLLHFLSTSEIASTLSLHSLSKKRKRARLSEPDPESTLCQLVRVESVKRRNPDSFKHFFNMNSSTFEWLCGLLEPLLECRDPVDSPLNLDAETRLGIGLFRLASGADFREISNQFRVSVSASKFCVKQLCRVLCTNFRFWVGFPSPNELQSVSTQFETLTGMPNCCGVIQCARFKIRRNNEEDTIAAQIVVDSSSRILSIIAGFRGQKGDSQILKSSTLYKDIENGGLLNSQPMYINGVAVPQYFAGEGSYPLLPWLMLPFPCSVPGSNEGNFNNAHRITLLSAIKAIASLRNWGVLNSSIEAEDKIAVAYIGACSILHNMLLMREDFSAFIDEHSLQYCQTSQFPEESSPQNMALASAIRAALATKLSRGRNEME
ncbi:PREDICTED: putative nuclease HARBI1 [Ipomoea nil]|uniref:putative nuclease HARBI1 n=1 Tax=Ipomoea nil TaxID=35883 RepID=UPI000900DA7B|nr:PREDICTED: putative nuclease HARBI1 [Ipomoea nil]